MESVIEKCESTISELLKFSRSVLYLGKPIKDKRFIKFENEIGYELSIDFKYILERYNGFSLLGSRVFGLDSEYQESSLDRIYHFEHNIVENKMPSHFLPFSNDGSGNHYCLDLSRLDSKKICPVVFWQWDFKYETINEVETCNENFCDWVKEVLIDWTLEEYNFDGTKK